MRRSDRLGGPDRLHRSVECVAYIRFIQEGRKRIAHQTLLRKNPGCAYSIYFHLENFPNCPLRARQLFSSVVHNHPCRVSGFHLPGPDAMNPNQIIV